MYTSVASIFQLVWILLLWTWVYYLFQTLLSIFLITYPEKEFLGHMAITFLIFWGNSLDFLHWLYHFTFFQTPQNFSASLHPHQHLLFSVFCWLCFLFSTVSHSKGYEVVSHSFDLHFPSDQQWRRQWHPTPVLLPGKSHGRRRLEGCTPWGRWPSDTTEWLHFHFSLSCIGEGNGNPLQCSCLENPGDRGTWWAAVYGVAQSRTRMMRRSSSSSSSIFFSRFIHTEASVSIHFIFQVYPVCFLY